MASIAGSFIFVKMLLTWSSLLDREFPVLPVSSFSVASILCTISLTYFGEMLQGDMLFGEFTKLPAFSYGVEFERSVLLMIFLSDS